MWINASFIRWLRGKLDEFLHHAFHDFSKLAISPAVNKGVDWWIQKNEKRRDMIRCQRSGSITAHCQKNYRAQVWQITSHKNNLNKQGIYHWFLFSESFHRLTISKITLVKYLNTMITNDSASVNVDNGCHEKSTKLKNGYHQMILPRNENVYGESDGKACRPQSDQKCNSTTRSNEFSVSQVKKYRKKSIHSDGDHRKERCAGEKIYAKIIYSQDDGT